MCVSVSNCPQKAHSASSCPLLDTDSESGGADTSLPGTFQGPQGDRISRGFDLGRFAFICSHDLERRGTRVTCGECLHSQGFFMAKMHVSSLLRMPGRRECTAALVSRGALPQPHPEQNGESSRAAAPCCLLARQP